MRRRLQHASLRHLRNDRFEGRKLHQERQDSQQFWNSLCYNPCSGLAGFFPPTACRPSPGISAAAHSAPGPPTPRKFSVHVDEGSVARRAAGFVIGGRLPAIGKPAFIQFQRRCTVSSRRYPRASKSDTWMDTRWSMTQSPWRSSKCSTFRPGRRVIPFVLDGETRSG